MTVTAPAVTVNAGDFATALNQLAGEVAELGRRLAETQESLAEAIRQLGEQQLALRPTELTKALTYTPPPSYSVDVIRGDDGEIRGMIVDRSEPSH